MITKSTPERFGTENRIDQQVASFRTGQEVLLETTDVRNIIAVLNVIRENQLQVEAIEVFDVLGQAMLAVSIAHYNFLVDWQRPNQLIPLTPEQQNQAPGSIDEVSRQMIRAQLLAFLLGGLEVQHKDLFD